MAISPKTDTLYFSLLNQKDIMIMDRQQFYTNASQPFNIANLSSGEFAVSGDALWFDTIDKGAMV